MIGRCYVGVYSCWRRYEGDRVTFDSCFAMGCARAARHRVRNQASDILCKSGNNYSAGPTRLYGCVGVGNSPREPLQTLGTLQSSNRLLSPMLTRPPIGGSRAYRRVCSARTAARRAPASLPRPPASAATGWCNWAGRSGRSGYTVDLLT